METNYYCYLYLDPRKPGKYIFENLEFDFEPFYVGKGKNKRSNFHLTYVKRRLDKSFSHHFLRKIKCILLDNKEPIIYFYKKHIAEEIAYELETKLIEIIGLDNLTNIFPGGKGGRNNKNFAGKHHTKEAKIKLSNSHMGINNPMYGEKYYRSEEGKLSFSEKTSGTNHHYFNEKRSEEVKEKIRKKLKGIKLSDDQIKQRAITTKKVWDERKKNNISFYNKGTSISLIATNIFDKTELTFNSYKECGNHFKKCFTTIKNIVLNKKIIDNYIITLTI